MFHCRPPGVFEFNNFAKGTKTVMDAVVMATQNGATVIIGKDFLKGSIRPQYCILERDEK